MNLQQVIKRCQRGEKEAFCELFEIIEKSALATAYLISKDKEMAEDILQETYIKCFKEIKNIHNPDAFKPWFFRILVRTGWEMTKRQSRLIPTDDLYLNNAMICSEGHDSLDTFENRYIVEKAVDDLSPKLKTVVILYYYNDMSIEEISKILGCFKATVKSRLSYARRILKKKLWNFGVDFNLKECSDNE